MNTGGAFVAGSIVGKLLLDKTGWNASIKSVDKDKKSLNGMAANIGSAFVQLGKMAAVAGVAAAGTLAMIVKKTAEAGGAIWDMSQRTGIATETLSGLKLAADKSGTSLEGVALGLRFLGRNMAAGIESFKEMGVSVRDVNGNLRPMQDVILDVADRFARMENGAAKTALAIKLFGRSGTELIPMLNLGAEGLRKEIGLAEKLGLVFTEKTARAADRFKDTMTELNGALTGMRNDIGNALIPIFTKLAAGVTQALTFIRGKIAEFVASGALQEWAIGTAKVIIGAFKLMVQAAEGFMLVNAMVNAAFRKVLAATQDAVAVAADLIARVIGLTSAAAAVGYWTMAESARGAAATLRESAEQMMEGAYEKSKPFIALIDALDMISAGFGKAGTIANKTFKGMAAASGVSVDEMTANLEKLLADLESVANMEPVEFPIEFDFSNLDEIIPPDFMKDILDGAARAAAEASQKIRDSIKSLTAGGTIAETKNRIAEIEQALLKVGLTAEKIRELKDELARLKGVVADSTPWGRFVDAATTAISKIQQAYQLLGTAMSAVIDQARINAEIAIENEYKKRLAYINKNVKDETKRQAAIVALEAEYEIKKSAARAAAAKSAKAMSIMEAMVNTAVAVTSALKVFPPWLGIALAAVVGALGAIQVGLIAKQPIPLAEGASFEKPTLLQNVLVGEKRPEYLLDKPKLTDIVRDAMAMPRFLGAPAMAMAGVGGGGGTVTLNFNGPLVSSPGVSMRDLEAAGENLVIILDRQLRRVGRRL
jgi:hypothetical protein